MKGKAILVDPVPIAASEKLKQVLQDCLLVQAQQVCLSIMTQSYVGEGQCPVILARTNAIRMIQSFKQVRPECLPRTSVNSSTCSALKSACFACWRLGPLLSCRQRIRQRGTCKACCGASPLFCLPGESCCPSFRMATGAAVAASGTSRAIPFEIINIRYAFLLFTSCCSPPPQQVLLCMPVNLPFQKGVQEV